jgi:hypothetical protein
MATKTVRVSDLTGKQIQQEQSSVRLIVEHPDYPEPIGLDVVPDEVLPHLSEENSRFIVVSFEDADNPNQQRYVMSFDDFERLFEAGDSTSVLQQVLTSQQAEREKQPRRGGRKQAAGRRERIDWSSSERAGEDHPGRISMAEKRYVKEHLDEVNARRRAKNQPEIDPSDPEMAQRYDLIPPTVEELEEGTTEHFT